jgi:hypothetical protein
MHRYLILIALCFWGMLAVGQNQQLESAKDLQTACTTAMNVFEKEGAASPQDAAQYGKCLGYVEGVLDSMRVLTQTGKDGKAYTFHLHGEGFAVKDAVAFFLDFMKTDKEDDHDGPAAPFLIRALMARRLVTSSAVEQRHK